MVILSCTAENRGPPSAGTSTRRSPARPTRGGVLRFGILGAPATLDPYSPRASDLTRALVRPIYPSLYRFDANGHVRAELARSLHRRRSGIEIRLRAARWSDGTPLTARDVVASHRRAGPPSGFTAFRFARAAGPLRIRFGGGVRRATRALATAAYVLPRGRAAGVPRSSGGPFRIAGVRQGLQIQYVPNPRWPGPAPRLNGVTVQFVEDVRTMLELLERGRLDAAAPSGTVNLDDISIDGVEVEGRLGWESVQLQLTSSDLDRAERASLVARVERDLMEESFVRDDGRVARTVAPAPGAAGASGPWRKPSRGRLPLPTVEVAAPEGDELLALVQRAAYTQLEASGVDTELVTVDAATFYGPWSVRSPVDVMLRRVLRAPAFRRPNEGLSRMPRYPLFHVETYAAFRRGVHGVAPVPLIDGPLAEMERWWIEG